MTESNQLALSARAERAAGLAQALGLAPEALGVVLLTLLERTDALFAVKEAATGRYVHSNDRMDSLVGRPLTGLLDEDWAPTDALHALRAADQSAMVQTLPQVSEHRIDTGEFKREFTVTRLPLASADGAPARHLAVVWIDMTAQRQLEAQLALALAQLEAQQQAAEAQRRELQDTSLKDRATGLYQRGHFEDQLRREVDLSSREHREFAMVSVALDPLSERALALGEEARARILEALGRLLRSNTRAMDGSCRLGEDRFAVLLSGVGLATAHSRMEGLRRQCATQIVMLNGEDLGFTVSMGVASFPHTAHSQEELVDAADSALAEAQRRGGNLVTLASIRFESKQ
ncbi:diguanylate cyclase [Rhizobacter sp. LjRoot28]|uniref:sensor domain-containing diguanylate cyclase n=1 Tax=Rhizobacter sp. LjRoot28 TaxID=3342309 RepID=UPI003ED02F64